MNVGGSREFSVQIEMLAKRGPDDPLNLPLYRITVFDRGAKAKCVLESERLEDITDDTKRRMAISGLMHMLAHLIQSRVFPEDTMQYEQVLRGESVMYRPIGYPKR